MKGEEMELIFEQVDTVGVFNFSGELTREHEDNLKIALMKAIHGTDKAVLSFKKVTRIDLKCLQLLKQAYFTSIRLRNPLILTNLHQDYLKKVSHHIDDNVDYITGGNHERNDIGSEAACSQQS